MTTSAAHQTSSLAEVTGLRDPVLQELWQIKAQLNAQAGYSIDELVRRLNERQSQARLAAASECQS
jgi:hypothetical protein